MALNLEKMSHKELLQLKTDVEKEIKNAEKRAMREARAAAEKAVAEFGLTLDDVTGKAPAKPAAVAKYRNPENSADTWTGRGRKPRWFSEAIENGADPADLEI